MAHGQKFIEQVKDGAIRGWEKYGILPSLTIAQACLESGFGTSELAKKGNNLFGIKGDYNGNSITIKTKEYINGKWITVDAAFAKYPDQATSVEEHGAFFSSSVWREENYKHVFGESDYKEAVRAILPPKAEAGYATDHAYDAKIINIIEQYNLTQYDKDINQEVKTMAYVGIDIGHGSNTFPSQGKGVFKNNIGYSEHGFNSKVAIKLKEKLEASGIKVTYGLQQPNSPDIGLTRRTNWFNANKVDVVVSIHANASSNPAVNGRCAFYWHTSSKGKRLAQNIINEIKKKGYTTHGNGLHAGVRGSWTNLHINRETNMPAVLIEHGFMTGNKDFDLIFGKQRDKYVEDMADADARAICNYFGVTYKSGAKTEPSTPWERKSGQTGIFVADYGILIRDKPHVKANKLKGGILKGDAVRYNGLFHADGYSWLEVKDAKKGYFYFPYRRHSLDYDWGRLMSTAAYNKMIHEKERSLQKYRGRGKGFKNLKLGQTITVRKGHKRWLHKNRKHMELAKKDYAGSKDKISKISDVKIGYSNKAYYLERMKVWILEQDVVETRQSPGQ